MEHLKTQWETPKNQQNINRISPRINGHFQKSIETWNIQKKKRRPKNPQEFPWEIPKDRLPSSSGLRGRGKSENSDALDPSAASAALSVASARRVDMGHGEIHGKIHGKSLVVGYFPIMNLYWPLFLSWRMAKRMHNLYAGAQHMAFISQCQTPDSEKNVHQQAVAIYSESLIICRSEGFSSDSRVNSAVVILYIYLKYVYNCWHIYIYTCICVYMQIDIYIYIYIYIFLYIYILYIYEYTHTFI